MFPVRESGGGFDFKNATAAINGSDAAVHYGGRVAGGGSGSFLDERYGPNAGHGSTTGGGRPPNDPYQQLPAVQMSPFPTGYMSGHDGGAPKTGYGYEVGFPMATKTTSKYGNLASAAAGPASREWLGLRGATIQHASTADGSLAGVGDAAASALPDWLSTYRHQVPSSDHYASPSASYSQGSYCGGNCSTSSGQITNFNFYQHSHSINHSLRHSDTANSQTPSGSMLFVPDSSSGSRMSNYSLGWPSGSTEPVQPSPSKGASSRNSRTRTEDRYREVYTHEQTSALEVAFGFRNYITIDMKIRLAAELQLSERQVKVWFQNRRAKERKLRMRTSAPAPATAAAAGANNAAVDVSLGGLDLLAAAAAGDVDGSAGTCTVSSPDMFGSGALKQG